MTIQYDSNGIITQNLLDIIGEREANLQQVMGEDFIIDKTTPIGNMELADANNELSIQELIAWLFPNQMDANTATGIFLDVICEKNRIYRRQPEYTTMNLILNGTPKTQFNSGDIIVEDSISNLYYDLNEDCIIGEDGTVVAQFICEEFGENYPLSSTIYNIQTPMGGLSSVTMNYENLNIKYGRLPETDEELRRRRMYSVGQTATNTLDSMISSMFSLDGVFDCIGFENDTEFVDENGLPMKSFEIVIDGGDETEITDTILNNKAVGTRAYGATIVNKKSENGVVFQIGYTRASQINIGVEIQLNTYTAQSNNWKSLIVDDIKKKFDEIQKIGTTVKDYNYLTVLTKYNEISDIYSIRFYDVNAGEKTYYAQYPIGIKEIAKLNPAYVSIIIGEQ